MPVTTNTRKLAALLGASGAGIGTDGKLGESFHDMASQSELDTAKENLSLVAFRQAVDHTDVKYSLVDQVIDEFVDNSGIDTINSVNDEVASGFCVGQLPGNYYGSDVDGIFSTSGNVTHTVLNKNGSYDGDMFVKNYQSLTINASHTMTVDQPCRGMLIYVSGNCVINGTLTMTGKGALANPASSGGSDSSAVGTNGIRLPVQITGGTDTLAAADFAGCGTAAVTAVANHLPISGTAAGTIYAFPRIGAAGGTGPTSGTGNQYGDAGDNGPAGQAGGGGSGARSENYSGGDGAVATCFSGGAGGGGGDNSTISPNPIGAPGVAYGGAGGAGTNVGGYSGNGAGGGAGNPGGTHIGSSVLNVGAESGIGGLLILMVGGVLSGSGAITSHGKKGGYSTTSGDTAGGGGSGGGNILILTADTATFSGAKTATGGLGGGMPSGIGSRGGNGGNGSVQGPTVITSVPVTGNLDLRSNATEAETQPDSADLVVLYEDNVGTAVINTDIKGYVSRDNGANWVQATLVSQGTATQKVLSHHGIDISGQATDKTMKWRITTHNQTGSKKTRIHATSLGWA